MNRKNKNVFLIFFLFSALLFLSFEAFHFYLVHKTGSFLRDFAKERVLNSFQEFENRLSGHDLFQEISQKKNHSELLWNHFHKEMVSIEREFELRVFVLSDENGQVLLGSERSRSFLASHQMDPLNPKLSDSFFFKNQVLELDKDRVGNLLAVFAVPFSQVNQVQKNYLKLGFFFFLALLSGALFIVWGLIQRLSSLEDESQRSKRLAQFGSLAAGVAHDVRNPLSILGLQLQELREMHENDRESLGLVNKMGKEIKRIDHTVASLLIFGRESLPFDQPIIIEDIIAEILGQEDIGNMELSVNVPRVALKGNHDLIYRMFENLLRNSSEAVGEEMVAVKITGEESDSQLVLIIEDNGPGLEHPDRVFDEFFTTKKEGTGLGLLVVKDAVQRHQGRVECSSIQGKGTSFTIRFPLSKF